VIDIDHLFALAKSSGQTISELSVEAPLEGVKVHMILEPREVRRKIDKAAPPELPDSFDDLPAPNWTDPGDKPDTPANRKAAAQAQAQADAETLGADIPEEFRT
jgi:hypothetical protein